MIDYENKYISKQFFIWLLILVTIFSIGYISVESIEDNSPLDNTGKWISILPSFIAILLSLIFKQVIISLFAGVWLGAYLVSPGGIISVFESLFATTRDYIIPSIADTDHASIIVFSLLIGGMVGIISANGGMTSFVHLISQKIKGRRGGQLLTSFMGMFIFFDDYANTMIIGNTARPLTDRVGISRAKLAYLVDSTSAPIATIALISTWIGFMVGSIGKAVKEIGEISLSPYSIFLSSLPYNFYAYFCLVIVLVVGISCRDWGRMYQAESNIKKIPNNVPSLDGQSVETQKQKKYSRYHWLHGVFPILILIIVTSASLFITGDGNNIQAIVSTADSYSALVWGALASIICAFSTSLLGKSLTIKEATEAMFQGMQQIFQVVLILVLAWSLSKVAQDLNTASFLVSLLKNVLDPNLVPTLVLLLAGIIAFATGTSWATMGILMPLTIPLIWTLGHQNGLSGENIYVLLYASVSSILAGAVWGDHCSPISDTTILSSLASRCDHIEHVQTQLPYSLFGGLISLCSLFLVTYVGFPLWLVYLLGIITIIWVFYKFGKKKS